MNLPLRTFLAAAMCATACTGSPHASAQSPAQASLAPAAEPVPAAAATPSAPKAPPRTFHDPAYKVSFDFPATWTFARRDREISTFRLDARSATPATTMRAVASIPENPFPLSTFSGAYFYLSVTPHSTDASCARQASTATGKPPVADIAGLTFVHGHNEQRSICTVERDEIYTVLRRGICYRFDLAINNFCGGEVSGVKDITQQELDNVRGRMESILATVRFDPK